MTKRMIGADALNALFQNIIERQTYNIMGVECDTDKAILINILHRINELATTAPEPQKSIFDADGWCWDLSLIDNDGEYHFLIASPREGVGYKVTDKKFYYQRIGLTWFITEDLETNESLGDKIVAYRLLPKSPTRGTHD